MLFLVLVVIFTLCLFLWLLALLGSAVVPATASGWIPFFSVLILGVVTFLIGSGKAKPPA